MRLHPDNRKEQIIDAAVKVAGQPGGWSKLTRDAVAKEMKLVCENYGYTLTLLSLSNGDKVWEPRCRDLHLKSVRPAFSAFLGQH